MRKKIKLSIWYIAIASVMVNFYLVFSHTTTILYFLYGLIAMLGVLLHVFVIKNFNLKFVHTDYFCCKPSVLLNKFLLAQIIVFLLATWLITNLLMHGELNIRTSNISSNLMPNNFFIIIVNWINWVVIVSLILGINGCKHYFKYPDTWTLAKCLFPIGSKQPWLFFYNGFLNVEASIKIISLTTLFVILSAASFEMVANKYRLFSFFQYPITTSFIIVIIFTYLVRHIWKIIDFCSKKTTFDFISIFITVAILVAIIIFILNQIALQKIHLLKFRNIDGVLINKLFNDIIINKDRIKILILSINILLSTCTADLLLQYTKGNKVGIIYLVSSIYPLIFSFILYKPIILSDFINILTTNSFNIFVIAIIFAVLIINYTNIYSFSELKTFKLKKITKTPRTIKTRFNPVVKQIIYSYFIYLSGYYMFAWIMPMHILAIISIFLLPGLIMLLFKVLVSPKYINYLLEY